MSVISSRNLFSQVAAKFLNPRVDSTGTESPQDHRCPHCRDQGYFLRGNTAFRCKCIFRRQAEAILRDSGIDTTKAKKLRDYVCSHEEQRTAVRAAVEFVRDFRKSDRRSNGFMICGIPGSGKTHIVQSTALALIGSKKPVRLSIMQYIETMQRLKGLAANEYECTRLRDRYIDAECLWIEDLFKDKTRVQSSLSEADIKQIHPIINTRYNRQKERPMLITTELTLAEIKVIDGGIGRRIEEMCRPFIFEFVGEKFFYEK